MLNKRTYGHKPLPDKAFGKVDFLIPKPKATRSNRVGDAIPFSGVECLVVSRENFSEDSFLIRSPVLQEMSFGDHNRN